MWRACGCTFEHVGCDASGICSFLSFVASHRATCATFKCLHICDVPTTNWWVYGIPYSTRSWWGRYKTTWDGGVHVRGLVLKLKDDGYMITCARSTSIVHNPNLMQHSKIWKDASNLKMVRLNLNLVWIWIQLTPRRIVFADTKSQPCTPSSLLLRLIFVLFHTPFLPFLRVWMYRCLSPLAACMWKEVECMRMWWWARCSAFEC